MTFLDAAIAVLSETAREMTAQEIVRVAIKRGLVSTTGRTPAATMSSRLYVQVRDHPEGPIRKIAQSGATRSRRDSVKWVLRVSEA